MPNLAIANPRFLLMYLRLRDLLDDWPQPNHARLSCYMQLLRLKTAFPLPPPKPGRSPPELVVLKRYLTFEIHKYEKAYSGSTDLVNSIELYLKGIPFSQPIYRLQNFLLVDVTGELYDLESALQRTQARLLIDLLPEADIEIVIQGLVELGQARSGSFLAETCSAEKLPESAYTFYIEYAARLGRVELARGIQARFLPELAPPDKLQALISAGLAHGGYLDQSELGGEPSKLEIAFIQACYGGQLHLAKRLWRRAAPTRALAPKLQLAISNAAFSYQSQVLDWLSLSDKIITYTQKCQAGISLLAGAISGRSLAGLLRLLAEFADVLPQPVWSSSSFYTALAQATIRDLEIGLYISQFIWAETGQEELALGLCVRSVPYGWLITKRLAEEFWTNGVFGTEEMAELIRLVGSKGQEEDGILIQELKKVGLGKFGRAGDGEVEDDS